MCKSVLDGLSHGLQLSPGIGTAEKVCLIENVQHDDYGQAVSGSTGAAACLLTWLLVNCALQSVSTRSFVNSSAATAAAAAASCFYNPSNMPCCNALFLHTLEPHHKIVNNTIYGIQILTGDHLLTCLQPA